MSLYAQSSVVLVVLLHFSFMVLEMFLWDKPAGLKIFNHSKELAAKTKVLAAKQGLNNCFLAAGLIWGLFRGTQRINYICLTLLKS